MAKTPRRGRPPALQCRANVDDPSLGRTELVKEGVRDIEHAIQIDRQNIVPVLGHGSRVAGDRIAAVDAGVVDEDGDGAAVGDLGGRGLACPPVGNIELHRRCLPACCRDKTDGLLRTIEVEVQNDDARAFPGVGLAYTLSDA
jgi:hypothetical protein